MYRSIHESSRIATEISSLDSKLASLTAIKQTLITGDNISTSNLDQLSKYKCYWFETCLYIATDKNYNR